MTEDQQNFFVVTLVYNISFMCATLCFNFYIWWCAHQILEVDFF